MGTGISNLTAAQLSQAAYPGYAPPNGWVAVPAYTVLVGSPSGTNGFTTFVNMTTNQMVIAFKGTDFGSTTSGLLELISVLGNDGGSAWESIASQFASVL